uniref:DUF2470 domain-containing protein n=1 Tax=Phaeomonas parva TaxID=124430 RepID=A0A6U4F2Y4_9STRA
MRSAVAAAAALGLLAGGAGAFSATRRAARRAPLRMVLAGDDILASTEDETGVRCSLSVPERARSVTQAAKSGTLCTISQGELEGMPFGSYVDYVLDNDGHPVLLLNEQSMHTRNMLADGRVSMLVQLKSTRREIPAAAQPRCTVAGRIAKVDDKEEILQNRVTYSLAHSYAEQVIESPSFSFYKIIPERVYYVGGFGVLSEWVDVQDYQQAQPDILADKTADLVDKVNEVNGEELPNLYTSYLAEEGDGELQSIRVTTVDRLGMDLRVKHGDYTDEYRLGFRMAATTLEDAQSEITKLFQEAWEVANGYYEGDTSPPVEVLAKDALRRS